MALVVVMADTLSLRPPTAAEVETAFRAARLAGNDRDRGAWVGSRARVVRGWNPFSRGHTTVAWLYAWPTAAPWGTGAPLAELSRELARNVAGKLEEIGGSWEVRALRYDPVLHGAVEWWRDGAAAATETRDTFPVLPEGVAGENPVGPGRAARGVEVGAAHTATAAEIFGDALDTAGTIAAETGQDARDAADAARRAATDGGLGSLLVGLGTLALVGSLLWTFSPAVRVAAESWAVERRYQRARGA